VLGERQSAGSLSTGGSKAELWLLLIAVLAASTVVPGCSLEPPPDQSQVVPIPLSRDARQSAVSRIIAAVDLVPPAMVIVLDPRSVHDRAAVDWMGKTFPPESARWVLIIDGVRHLAGFLSNLPDSGPSADSVPVPTLKVDRLSPGVYGIPQSGGFLESLGPLARRDLMRMRELLASTEALEDGYRETVVESIEVEACGANCTSTRRGSSLDAIVMQATLGTSRRRRASCGPFLTS